MKKIFCILIVMLGVVAFTSCSDDEGLPKPHFSEITVSPVKDVYNVGDKIVLTVKQITENPEDIRAEKEWFFYPDGKTENDRILFVTRTADTNEFISPEITLTKAGNVELSFWTQYDYPNFKYDGVTLYKTISVIE
ncbi:MAG: hypothetical protein KBS65_00770 [Prevotella sp.]|nr:hypothetical protein [Candidatus Equicola stercoris]